MAHSHRPGKATVWGKIGRQIRTANSVTKSVPNQTLPTTLGLLAPLLGPAAGQSTQPNIVNILADDFG